MHMSEGVLSIPVLTVGTVLGFSFFSVGLKKLKYSNLPRTAILAASCFVISLFHIPLGPTKVHLLFNGILGVLLGWAVFPAILVSLLLQVIFFQHGGFTTLGFNTFSLGFPGLISWFFFRSLLKKDGIISSISAFGVGFFSVNITAIIIALSLIFSGINFTEVAKLVFIVNFPITVIEGVLTSIIISFFQRVKPDML